MLPGVTQCVDGRSVQPVAALGRDGRRTAINDRLVERTRAAHVLPIPSHSCCVATGAASGWTRLKLLPVLIGLRWNGAQGTLSLWSA
jgi:hypothetical protein